MMRWELLLNHDHSQQRLCVAGSDRSTCFFSQLGHGWVVVAEFDAVDFQAARAVAKQMSPTYRDDKGALRFRDPRTVN